MPPSAAETPCPRRGEPVFTGGNKRGKGHRMVPFPPLDSPKPSFEPLSKAFAAKRGLRELGSGRRAAFGTLLVPEVSLRELPRISVRGQTVQGGGVPLRKAPLRSRVCPWCTKRPCGPLAFRRATEGSRVQRRVWGVKRGKGTIGALSPLVSAARRRQRYTPSEGVKSPPAANRCIGGKAYRRLTVKKLRLRQQNCNYIPFKEGVSHRYVNPC